MSRDKGLVSKAKYHRQDETPLLRGKRPSEVGPRSSVLSSSKLSTMFSNNRSRNVLKLIREIRDFNADASKAISNMLRLVNSGFEIKAVMEDGETPNDVGQEIIDKLIRPEPRRIAKEYGGGASVLVDMATLMIATQGALAMEVEIADLAADEPIEDAVVLNPWVIDWRKNERNRWEPGIWNYGDFIPLHPLQFRYFPLDPEPNDPRGRSGFLAALDVIFFQMEVLKDLKQAVHFTGYPRVDISVAYEAVLNAIKVTRPDLMETGKEKELRAELQGYLDDISDLVDDLETDDAFIHYDSVDGKYIVPTGRSVDLNQLIGVVDTQVIAGLKQLPVLMGRNAGSTETHATVQWQVFSEELAHIQGIIKTAFDWLFTLCLRISGVPGMAITTFDKIRSIDRKGEAEVEQILTETKMSQVRNGWIDNDEAAQAVVGHDAVDEPLLPPVPPPVGDEDDDEEDQDAPDDEDIEEEDERLSQLRMVPGLADFQEHQEETERILAGVLEVPKWQQNRYRRFEEMAWAVSIVQGDRAREELEELGDGEPDDEGEDNSVPAFLKGRLQENGSSDK